MAGGKGLRLRPFTYVAPKPLLGVNGINSIEFSIKNLKKNGVEDLFISINYLKEKFEVCKKYEKKYQVNITLIEEQKQMGTVGSLMLMRDHLNEEFIMINGDLFADVNYRKNAR